MQEDKERLFDTVDTVRATVNILAAMLRDTEVNARTCAKAVKDPNLLATDLVDWLVLAGMPFRKAHHVVSKIVVAKSKNASTSYARVIRHRQETHERRPLGV